VLRALPVAVTVAPAWLAIWTAYPPTAPPAPLIRMLWAAFRPAYSNSDCQAVRPADGVVYSRSGLTYQGRPAGEGRPHHPRPQPR